MFPLLFVCIDDFYISLRIPSISGSGLAIPPNAISLSVASRTEIILSFACF
jgi:hypothetical protein